MFRLMVGLALASSLTACADQPVAQQSTGLTVSGLAGPVTDYAARTFVAGKATTVETSAIEGTRDSVKARLVLANGVSGAELVALTKTALDAGLSYQIDQAHFKQDAR